MNSTDLPGALLGEARGASIALDRTAAGWGWFVDPTPNDDDEFGKTIGAEAVERIDLLTVLYTRSATCSAGRMWRQSSGATTS